MPYEKSNKQIQDSAFKMKASKYGGPMQKNFGKHLAINKKLDKDSMSGGLTGQPGKELDGPMAKKFRLFKKPTAEQQAKRNKLKSDVKKFTGGIKKAGSDVNKKLQKAGDYLSAKSIKARRAARKAKKDANKSDAAYYGSAKDKAKNSEANRIKKTPPPANNTGGAKKTFKKAFAAARKAGKKTFSWNSKSYTTELAKKKK